jgi:hypothetical protein
MQSYGVILQRLLLERKTLLKNTLPRQAAERIRFTDHMIGHGKRLFALLENKRPGGDGREAPRQWLLWRAHARLAED